MVNDVTRKEAFQRLLYWQQGGNSFSCKLYDLFVKADEINVAKLSKVYPMHYLALLEWELADDPEALINRELHP